MNREEFKKIVAEAKAVGYKEGYTAGEQDANDRQDYQEQREAEEG